MGGSELLLIFVVYLLLFGAKGIPSLAQTLGKVVYQFRNAARDVQREIMDTSTKIQREINLEDVMADEPKKSRKASATVTPPTTRPEIPPAASPTQDTSTKPDQDF